jgi:meso-butanediol dehydrogenase / (S,S)-butanediol dehydrogenase / diacetyl reductase
VRRLEGRVALVTGGAQGIGKAISQRLVEEGASVVVADINARQASQTARGLSDRGTTISQHLDVTNEESVREAIASIVNREGRLDILVNNAGTNHLHRASIDDQDSDDWDRVIAVNLTGVFYCTKHAVRVMRQQRRGVIINLGSGGAGIDAQPGIVGYCASKGAVVLLTKAVALEVATQGIRVNCICPGNIDTPLLRRDIANLGPGGREWVASLHPIGRLGKPREIGDAAVFLASDESSLLTGASLVIDGGFNAGRVFDFSGSLR